MKFIAYFDFTTFHRGSKCIGRTGQVCFETEYSLQEVNNNLDEVQSLVVSFVHSKYPKWKILIINVNKITTIKPVTEIEQVLKNYNQ